MELFSWMNVFNRPISDQLFYCFAIFIALFCGIKLLKCLQALPGYIRMTHYVAKLPQITCFPVLNYFRYLPLAYKIRKEAPPIAYVFQMICGLCKAYPKTGFFNLWLITRSVILLYKAETVEVILTSNTNIAKSREYRFLESWLGTGLITSKGSTWKNRRRLLTPAFHFRILEDFFPICNDKITILINKLTDHAKEDWIDVTHLINMCALDIVCESAMGVSINAQDNAENEYVNALRGFGDSGVFRGLLSFLSLEFIFYLLPSGRKLRKNLNTIHTFIKKVIKERKSLYLKQMTEKSHGNKETCENDTASDVLFKRNKRKPFLELLLEFHFQDPSFTEDDMKDEVNTFMFAGHDTTSTASSWALFNIGLHPNIQEKVIEELDTIFDGDNNRSLTLDDIKSMKFLDIVLKESMRLYPPVPFFLREITEDVVIDGNIVPAGCMAFIFPWMLHRDPDVYPHPEVFDPDRFLPENCGGRHPCAYVPFSAGPRNCIGQKFAQMEEKMMIAQILRRFRVKSLDTPDKVVMIPDLVLRCHKPLRIKFIPRVMQQ